MRLPGFLPVIYKWFKSRPHSVNNQTDSGPDLHKFDSPLQGWKILLLWIPAACDLTGTTVRLPNLLGPPIKSNLFHLVDECRPPLYTRFNFPNDTWRSGLVRRHFQCHIPPSPPLALSVYIPFIPIYASNILTSVSRWVSLIIVMAGVALVGYSGSLIKDAVEAITLLLARTLGNHNDNSLIHSSAEDPELGHVLVGKFSCRHLMFKSNLNFQTSCAPQGVFFILFAQVL
jgi:hypothetical protein